MGFMAVSNDNDVILAVVVATILFFLMVGFIISYFIIYRRKREEHVYEMRAARKEFEKQLLQTQLEIQEQTLSRVSEEIHDNVGQVLSLARIQINIMNESENFNRDMLNEVKENIGQAMTDLRDIARSMNSERVRNVNIFEAVMTEAKRINKSGIIHAGVLTEGPERSMNEQKKLILFRIIQECMQNILKHAEASEIDIRLCYMPAALEVSVRDNGKGFDPDRLSVTGAGLGLANMRTRASLMGGSVVIESEWESGTLINIKIPYE
jgi:two-component system, NarL family, sensor kinase